MVKNPTPAGPGTRSRRAGAAQMLDMNGWNRQQAGHGGHLRQVVQRRAQVGQCDVGRLVAVGLASCPLASSPGWALSVLLFLGLAYEQLGVCDPWHCWMFSRIQVLVISRLLVSEKNRAPGLKIKKKKKKKIKKWPENSKQS